MKNDEELLRFPIGRPEESDLHGKIYGDTLKFELLNDIKMLPAMIEFAVKDLDHN